MFQLKSIILCLSTLTLVKGDTKIVGGTSTSIKKYPYQISIQSSNNFHFCGGFLISSKWAVTAAHCFFSINENTDQMLKNCVIRVGSSVYYKGGQVIKIKQVIFHPRYGPKTHDNDIALLELASPVKTKKAHGAKLPKQNETIPENAILTISGWGETTEKSSTPATLIHAQVPFVDRNNCKKLYENFTLPVFDNSFCAGYINGGGVDSCQGDSGGPVSIKKKVVGITSWGVGCARPKFPGVYTQVSHYRNWIRDITGV